MSGLKNSGVVPFHQPEWTYFHTHFGGFCNMKGTFAFPLIFFFTKPCLKLKTLVSRIIKQWTESWDIHMRIMPKSFYFVTRQIFLLYTMKVPKIKHSDTKLNHQMETKIRIWRENRQFSLLKYKEQIFQIALQLHKYNSQGSFLSSPYDSSATANQKH